MTTVVLGSATVYFTSVTVREAARANDINARATRIQLELTREQHVAQQFTEAIAQLGEESSKRDDNLSLRIGAITSLSKIMQISPKDQPAIVKILCAFIRAHAATPWPAGSAARPRSSDDVVAAIEALAQRPSRSGHDAPLDTRYSYISMPFSDFRKARLAGADFGNAHLKGSNFADASLRFITLDQANLESAKLPGADMRSSKLHGANLQHASLLRSNLAGADLSGAMLGGADLTGAELARANLKGADLSETTVTTEQLRCAVVGRIAGKSTKLPPGVFPPAQDAFDHVPCGGGAGTP